MGIDIHVHWKGQTKAEEYAQYASALFGDGRIGCLREPYEWYPSATQFLCREAFESRPCIVKIPAGVLRERLPEALRMAEARMREFCEAITPAQIEPALTVLRDFVSLCELKEEETGVPVTIFSNP